MIHCVTRRLRRGLGQHPAQKNTCRRRYGWVSLFLGAFLAVVLPVSSLAQVPTPPSQPSLDIRQYRNLHPYDLGNTTLTQAGVAAEFATMPLPLTGILGLPHGTDTFPLAVILHGRHGGCHFVVDGPSQWPCPAGLETRYDEGFAYLAQALTEAGYGVVVPNLNAAFSATYGATPERRNALADQRSQQIIDAHLRRLAAANRGEDTGFGPDLVAQLAGRVDWARLAMVGHSMGGGAAALSAVTRQAQAGDGAMIRDGLGPVAALVLVAPTRSQSMTRHPEAYQLPDVPSTVLIGGCDRDIFDLSSLYYFETATQDRTRSTPAAAVIVLGANHNFFNAAVGEDDYYRRQDNGALCNPQRSRQRLSRVAQETFLVEYVQGFLGAVLNPHASPAQLAAVGLAPQRAVPATLYQVPVLTNLTQPQRRLLFEASNRTHTYQTSSNLRVRRCLSFAPCDNLPRARPQFPAILRLQWPDSTAWIRFPLESQDFSPFTSLQLRLAAEPSLQSSRPSLALVLHDRQGRAVRVEVPATAPALYDFEASANSHAPLTPIYPTALRIPLAQFYGVDLTALAALDLVFDGASRGTLQLASVEFLASPSLDR